MAHWKDLQVDSFKGHVRSVHIPADRLEEALRATGCRDLSGDCRAKVRDWLLDQLEEQLALPVFRHPAMNYLHEEPGGARLIFFTY